MNKPSFRKLNLRDNFEKSVIEAFINALNNLLYEPNLPKAENQINRILYRLIKQASHYELWDVRPEANNLPDLSSISKEVREDKRPDFTCYYKDPLEEIAENTTKEFIVECKRLGKIKINKNQLNELYITNGVLRFINKSHGYGQKCKSGAMIGYVQDMNFDDILSEVNSHISTHKFTNISLGPNGWKVKSVSELHHTFDRPEIEPSPFKLNHLWVDLR